MYPNNWVIFSGESGVGLTSINQTSNDVYIGPVHDKEYGLPDTVTFQIQVRKRITDEFFRKSINNQPEANGIVWSDKNIANIKAIAYQIKNTKVYLLQHPTKEVSIKFVLTADESEKTLETFNEILSSFHFTNVQ